MTRKSDQGPPLEPLEPLEDEEREFVEQLARAYAPPPQTPAQRVAFDEALAGGLSGGRAGRRARPAHRALLIPALASAGLAAVLWFAFSSSLTGMPAEGETTVFANAWESELFLSSDLSGAEGRDAGEGLPDDYLAIESFFLGG